ncbi:hypothetical protein BDQ17DRAFT_1376419 [Cyathus striatus]|nr:hypothetical protein BDQ17DRAFT_1376419 [Cyathus striatus]
MCVQCRNRVVSLKVPNRTLSEMKSAVNSKLLERKTFTSLAYLLRDIHLHGYILHVALTTPRFKHALNILDCCIWVLYFWFQSLTFTGLWIIAHEVFVDTGHFPFILVCNAFGFIIHTALGTPYFSWKYSHTLHHKFNGHIEKDQHMIPHLRVNQQNNHAEDRTYRQTLIESMEDTPILLILKTILHQLLGFQAYLVLNISGPAGYPWWTSHLNPWSKIFHRKHLLGVIASDLGLMAWVLFLYDFQKQAGLQRLLLLYIIPWLLLSHWITMIVYLQHTDPIIPHYRMKDWKYAPAQLATMDREFLGWQGRFFLHHISSTHVVHHIFPKLPFYHAEEATRQLRILLGTDYNYCETPAFRALWNNIRLCTYVDDNDEVLLFRDKNGKLMKERILQ